MAQREFNITIGPDGGVEVEARGFKGRNCTDVVKWFEKIVGEIKAERKTSEFYEPAERVRFEIEQRH
jgi:hypothetical protein